MYSYKPSSDVVRASDDAASDDADQQDADTAQSDGRQTAAAGRVVIDRRRVGVDGTWWKSTTATTIPIVNIRYRRDGAWKHNVRVWNKIEMFLVMYIIGIVQLNLRIVHNE